MRTAFKSTLKPDTLEFNPEELNILCVVMGRAIEKTSLAGRTYGGVHGEIYTRMRQEMLYNGAPFNEGILEILKGKFKHLPWRLTNRQKEQLMTLFTHLGGPYRITQARDADKVYDSPHSEMDLLQIQMAKAFRATEDAKQNVKDAEQIAQQIKELDDFIREGN